MDEITLELLEKAKRREVELMRLAYDFVGKSLEQVNRAQNAETTTIKQSAMSMMRDHQNDAKFCVETAFFNYEIIVGIEKKQFADRNRFNDKWDVEEKHHFLRIGGII